MGGSGGLLSLLPCWLVSEGQGRWSSGFRGRCLCIQETDCPAMGMRGKHEGGEENRGRRGLAEEDENVSAAVLGVRGAGTFSAATPAKTSETHSWPAWAVGSRGARCAILALIPNYQVVQSTLIEGISGDEVKSTSNQSAEPGRKILPGKDKDTADPG